MAEYIKRILAKAEFTGNSRDEYPTALIHALIDSIPAADVAPVRRGRWETKVFRTADKKYSTVLYGCSECECLWGKAPYCPNCGAKMEEVSEE